MGAGGHGPLHRHGDSLTERLNGYRKHGEDKNAGHWGGRYLWQYAGWEQTVVCWMVTDGDPVNEESGPAERVRGPIRTAAVRQPQARPTTAYGRVALS